MEEVYQNSNSSILCIGDNEYDTEDELEPNLSKSIIIEPSTCPNEVLYTNEISRLNDEVFELKKEVVSKDMIVHELKLEIGKLREIVSLVKTDLDLEKAKCEKVTKDLTALKVYTRL